MRKALRAYAKDKNGNLILIGTMPVPFSKDKCAPAVRQQSATLRDSPCDEIRRSAANR